MDDTSDESNEAEAVRSRFLLPPGCKDLIDVLRLQEEGSAHRPGLPDTLAKLTQLAQDLPASVSLPDPVTVDELAGVLHLKAFAIVCLLMGLHVSASLTGSVSFQKAAELCALFGVKAERDP